MRYGTIRWAFGEAFGVSLMSAAWSLSAGEQRIGMFFVGLTIVTFFADVLYANNKSS